MAAALIQKPDSENKQTLAYVVSLEKVFDGGFEDNVIIKICSIQKNTD
jgi:hypothetical protein